MLCGRDSNTMHARDVTIWTNFRGVFNTYTLRDRILYVTWKEGYAPLGTYTNDFDVSRARVHSISVTSYVKH